MSLNKLYKVISLAVSGLSNKIHSSGETVNESDFPPGRADQLVQSKHLRCLTPQAKPIIGVLIPDRGDRPVFMRQCKEYLERQTVKPNHTYIVDQAPASADLDVTYRYRIGCKHLFALGCDVVIFFESDDWYSADYIERMMLQWERAGRPELFGIGQTVYYHVFENKYVVIDHKKRASAMSTMVTKRILSMSWPRDNNPYLDVELWEQLRGVTFVPVVPICLGIKHGVGMVGGGAHNGDNAHYNRYDENGLWLRGIVGKDFEFYEQLKSLQE